MDEGAFSPEAGSLLFPNDEERKVKIKHATQNAHFAILTTMLSMFEIKNPAFAEEKEWRLISFGLKNSEEAEVKYRPCGNKIIPYFEIDILELGIAPIQDIVLGPKHQTPDHVVKNMLASAQLGSPNISRSTATYR